MPSFLGSLREFRLFRLLVICAVPIVVLAGIGNAVAAMGVAAGFAMHVVHVALLAMSLRSLVTGETDDRRFRIATAVSTGGRLVLLAIGLAAIGRFLPRDALWGACGALFAAQVHSFVTHATEGGAA